MKNWLKILIENYYSLRVMIIMLIINFKLWISIENEVEDFIYYNFYVSYRLDLYIIFIVIMEIKLYYFFFVYNN